MPVQPLASVLSQSAPARSRVAAAPPSDWDTGLAAIDLSRPAPRTGNNSAHLNGRNLRYGGDKGTWGVDVKYLTADMKDKTPDTPLDLFTIGSFDLDVKAARIEAREGDVNTAVSEALAGMKGPVKTAKVSLLDGNRVAVKGRATVLKFIPVPFSMRTRLEATSPTTLSVQPESVKIFGLPLWWAVKLLHIDIAKHIPGGMVSAGPRGSLAVDLKRVDGFKGTLTVLDITQGQAAITLGGAAEPALSRARTLNNPNYCEVIATGEVGLDAGILRNATVVILDQTPETPYTINKWDLEGYARIERGQVVLPEDKLRARFNDVGDGFTIKKVALSGTDLVVNGSKDLLGIAIPVNFKIRFSPNAKGELKLTPHDVHVVGLNFGQGQIVSAMAKMKGMRKEGNGVILDMMASSRVEMPPIKGVSAEKGRIVLDS